MVDLAVFACLLRATTRKGDQLFKKKVHPRKENAGHAYDDNIGYV